MYFCHDVINCFIVCVFKDLVTQENIVLGLSGSQLIRAREKRDAETNSVCVRYRIRKSFCCPGCKFRFPVLLLG